MSTSMMWFRLDLRTEDNPALVRAAEADEVLPVFVIDPDQWDRAGAARRAWLAANLLALDDTLGGHLAVHHAPAADVVPQLAADAGAGSVHVTRDLTPFALRRDRAVVEALREAGVEGVATGTGYAVAPGSVTTKGATPFKIFTPYSKAWREHGWDAPVSAPEVTWAKGETPAEVTEMLQQAVADCPIDLPDAGEEAAWARWTRFRDEALHDYDTDRDRPAVEGTSRMSLDLHLGVLHPRQLLEDIKDKRSTGAHTYRTELAWRDFYAEVLHLNPHTVWRDLNPLDMPYDEPEDAIEAWKRGETGYPFVDAGMRQLLAQGWMHNRLRMITASFLTKHLHVWWPLGAEHFLDHLLDGDVASNSHGWQWVAGTGTDAAPYFRIFNPVTQGQRFDPDGEYVRRWVPELEHLPGKAAHTPWEHEDGYAKGYPRRIVDLAEERKVALDRYEKARHG